MATDAVFSGGLATWLLLPTPLKAFTDALPEVKAMLRISAHNLYGWQCDHESVKETNEAFDHWNDWDAYPESWPRKRGEKLPLGVAPPTEPVKASIERRKAAIRRDLEGAGKHYLREAVREARLLEDHAVTGRPATAGRALRALVVLPKRVKRLGHSVTIPRAF